MTNFKENDLVVEITNIDQWRDAKKYKGEVFLHDFFKRVISTDGKYFVVRSFHKGFNSSLFLPDDVVFSDSTGMNESKDRHLFNLTPYIQDIMNTLTPVLKEHGIENIYDCFDKDNPISLEIYLKSMRDSFLMFFDKLDNEVAA